MPKSNMLYILCFAALLCLVYCISPYTVKSEQEKDFDHFFDKSGNAQTAVNIQPKTKDEILLFQNFFNKDTLGIDERSGLLSFFFVSIAFLFFIIRQLKEAATPH